MKEINKYKSEICEINIFVHSLYKLKTHQSSSLRPPNVSFYCNYVEKVRGKWRLRGSLIICVIAFVESTIKPARNINMKHN